MESLIPLRRVAALLDTYSAGGVRVLGADGFHVVGDAHRPDLGAILDLSSVTDPAESVNEARAFFQTVTDDQLVWEFVTDQQD